MGVGGKRNVLSNALALAASLLMLMWIDTRDNLFLAIAFHSMLGALYCSD